MQTLTRSNTNTITGTLFIQLGSFAFPEVGWNDALVRVLTVWCQSCLLFGTGAKTVEFLFQDGSFGWDTRPGMPVSGVECYSWNSTRRIVRAGNVDLNEVQDQVILAARQIWNACARNGWSSPDVTQLEGAWRQAVAHVATTSRGS